MANNQAIEAKVSDLMESLNSQNVDTRLSAIYDLGEMKSETAIPQFLKLFQNKNTDLDSRWAIVESLGKIGSSEVLPSLINCLEDGTEDINIRRSAINSLSKINSSQAVLALLRFAENEQINSFLKQQIKYKIVGELQSKVKNKFSFSHLIASSKAKLEAVEKSLSEFVSVVDSWQVINPKMSAQGYGYSMRDNDKPIESYLEKKITIVGKFYNLTVKASSTDEDEDNWYVFCLEPQDPTQIIQKGTKLRLLDEKGEAFEHNEAEADSGAKKLEIEVALESGEGIIWETEPVSDGYFAEPLYF